VRLVLVGERGVWPPGEIAAALGVPVAQVVPVDRRGAGVLAGRMVPRKGWTSAGWTRLPLLSACHTLARRLAGDAAATADRPASAPPLTTTAGMPAVRQQVNGRVVQR
jgi:hypothetical protein